jgi:hypothetical protein
MGQFTELMAATAIANAEERAEVARLADELLSASAVTLASLSGRGSRDRMRVERRAFGVTS